MLADTSLPPSVSYPLGLTFATTLNLAAAEIWIHRHRARRAESGRVGALAAA